MSDSPRPSDMLVAWLAELERQGKSSHTIAAYRRALIHFIGWHEAVYEAAFDPDSVMPRDVRDWKVAQQTRERAAPATINQRLVALSRFFQWARQAGMAREDPTEGVRTVRLPPRRPKSLPDRDLRRLLRAARGEPRDYAMLEVLAGTGVRVGELLALRLGDVEIGERSGRLIVRLGKGDTYREVPLTRDVRKALAAYLETHPERDDPDAALWLGPRGSLSHRSSVLRVLNKYALQAGMNRVNPHALRHTFATRYLKANPGDLRGLARLLGHASLNTVMIYTEPDMDDLAERMERMEQGG
jgi:site-specific recombinase XerC